MSFILTLSHNKITNVITSSDAMLIATNKFSKRILLILEKFTFSTQDWTNFFITHLNTVDWKYLMIIISDRDSKFLFDFWKEVFKRLTIDFLYSTIYHSQIDDSSERINQTAEIALKHYLLIIKNSTEWFKVLFRF